MKTRARRVVCWVERGFEAWDVASACQVLSEAGSNWNFRSYRIQLVSVDGGMVASSAQLTVHTTALAAAEQPDVFIVAGGEHARRTSETERNDLGASAATTPAPLAATNNPVARWDAQQIDWLCLRSGLLLPLRWGLFAQAMVSTPRSLRPRASTLAATLTFSDEPWCRDGNLRTTATADASAATLDLVQSRLGGAARRAIELSSNIDPVTPPLRFRWPTPTAKDDA